MAKELTTVAIEKLKPGPTRREIPDGRVGGLYFIVQPSGKQSWAFRYRFAGKPRKHTLGTYPAIGLKTARERAGEAKDKIAEGKDPGAEKKASRAAALVPANDLVEGVVKQFVSYYAKRKLKPATAREIERLLEKEVVAVWRGQRLSQIDRPDIHELLDGIVARGSPVTANRTLAWSRRMGSWAVERGLIIANPFAGIKRPSAEMARNRVLSDDELAAAWRAAAALAPQYTAFIQLLILTGARRSEVAGMTWSEIDAAPRVWTLPAARAKNATEYQIPLSDSAVDILRALPRIGDFVLTFGRAPITGFGLIKERLDASMPADTAPWTLHDLRRTFASGCARLGIAVHVVEAALNHRSGSISGIAAIYNKYDYFNEKRAAMAAWARHVEAIVSGEAAANVIELAKARV